MTPSRCSFLQTGIAIMKNLAAVLKGMTTPRNKGSSAPDSPKRTDVQRIERPSPG